VLTGVVYDSIGRSALAGATVQIIGAADSVTGRSYSAQSDAAGRYRLEQVAPGSYVAGFFHVTLDTLGLESGTRAVSVQDGDNFVDLTTPSSKGLIERLCPPQDQADSTALLIGHVKRTDTEAPIVGATVTVEWGETLIEVRNIRMRNRLGTAVSLEPGWFALCGVPSNVPLSVRAAHGADSSGTVEVELARDAVRHVTFYVGGAFPKLGTSVVEPDSGAPVVVPMTMWYGNARLTGQVLDERGEPLSGARVSVVGTEAAASTSANGYFTLDSLPGGTQSVEVKALGYLPTSSIVHLAAERPATTLVRIPEPAAILPEVRVRARLVYARNLITYQQHKNTGYSGHFLDPQDIERMPVGRFSGLLTNIPGVRVSYNTGSGMIVMNASGSEPGAPIFCEPSVYIDGVRSRMATSELEALYYTDEVAALEVYTRPNQRPVEYQDQNSRCGAIVIWTRPTGRARQNR
jgi:hypothetical protein